jgi:para-aminobenzoate synthetase
MQTLLIDNYDSYTFNLFQLIAAVNGQEPAVWTNDSPLETGWSDAFDNVVISPGPGRPDRPRDFGISADVIASSDIPVLGVCLGHQGIAAAELACVVPARQPRHGYLTRVRHSSSPLFRNIPQNFVAVRYHSLCVAEPLPEAIEAIAWAEDGVIMGLRHRARPLWGVQFHPESVATAFGSQLLANFRELTARYLAEHGPMLRHRGAPRGKAPGTPAATGPAPGSARTVSAPADPATGYRAQVRVLDHAVDTETAFTRLFAASPVAFWLDSARAEPGLARFSLMGDAAGQLAEVVLYRVGEQAVVVREAGGRAVRIPGTIFSYLDRELARRRIDAPELPFDFSGGYVGYFGYELKAECGSPNVHRAETPDAAWIFPGRMVVVDHDQRRTYLLALSDGSPEAESGALDWLSRAVSLLRTAGPGKPVLTGAPVGVPPDVMERLLARDRARYLDDIAICQRKLRQGESYEICLTNTARIAASAGDDYSFYRRLRRVNAAPYGAYLRFDDFAVACSSPERFLRVDRNGTVESKPIKGTAPRGNTPAEDILLRDELATSAKTRAENLMIVDLVRNDLGRVCEVGSVHVPRFMVTETYATVHQLVSAVRGRLRADVSVIDCVRACFPGGSMTGAPKLRTMEIIDSLETEARGVYSGAIGFLGCNRTADLNIVIRTAVLADGECRIGAGGAIVLDSDPVAEYDEMALKVMATLRACGQAPQQLVSITHVTQGVGK